MTLPSPMLTPESPSGFMFLIGYRMVEWREDLAVIALDVRPDHLNRSGVVHGGIFTTLVDTACGFSATFCPYAGRVRRVMTLSITTTFAGQASSGEIRAIGRKRGGGSRIVVCSAEVFNSDGELVAIGEGTYRYRTGSEKPEGIPL
jgi:uncharacterized protein (TIGR00369 family)